MEETLFRVVEPDSSGLHFTNQIRETAQANILTYQYFYNGGGVAVGDLNNDGLEDLYFTANQGQNKLFLNQGNLKFRDITLATGTGGREQAWSTGAVIVDINADGLKDIYVCYSGDLPEKVRRNQLFVNQGLDAQGVPFFKEMAAEFGLDDPAFSTSAYFSDLDKDGDLDLLLLNHNPALFNNLNAQAFKTMLQTPDPMSSSKIYQNDRGKFKDISSRAGIATGTLSYGLGASIADFNADGWPDIYIGNDYSAPDYFYLNQGDGTFANQLQTAFGHTSLYSMGVDAADFNRDGRLDLISLDMLPEDNKRQKLLHSPENYEHYDLFLEVGLHHQLMRNMLQVNNGDGTFSETGQAMGVSTTDWSWAPLFADFDNDGYPDLFVSNGFLKDFTNLDFINYRQQVLQDRKSGQQQILEMIAAMPATKVGNYAFKNVNGSKFENSSAAWGLDAPGNSNGAVYADLDLDGDLDLVVNGLNEPAKIYQNLASDRGNSHFLQLKLIGPPGNSPGIGAKVYLYAGSGFQFQEQQIYRGFQGNVSEILHFGLENPQLDSLRIDWPGGLSQTLVSPKTDQRLELKIADALPSDFPKESKSPRFLLGREIKLDAASEQYNDFKRQSQLLYAQSQAGPFLATGDFTGDGEEDLIASTNADYLLLVDGKSKNPSKLMIRGITGNVAALLPLDVDDDGDLDLYLGMGGYENLTDSDPALQDQLLINDGKGRFELSESGILPTLISSTGSLALWDLDNDGVKEIFVGGGYIPGRWPESSGSSLLKKAGQKYVPVEDPILSSLKRVKAAQTFDLDKDGSEELIIATEFGKLWVLSSMDGRVKDRTDEFFPRWKTGLWRSLLIEDLDGDGYPELLAGNWGLNSRLRTEAEIPVSVYFADFDQNGSVDPLMAFPVQGEEFPFLSRDELSGQMYRKKALFVRHEDFSTARISDILSPEELAKAEIITAENLETQLFTLKNGKFEAIALPAEVQFSPINSAVSIQDKAGKKSLLLLGNLENPRLKIGRIDANHGPLLEAGPGIGAWRSAADQMSGILAGEEVTAAQRLGLDVWIGIRNRGLKSIKHQK